MRSWIKRIIIPFEPHKENVESFAKGSLHFDTEDEQCKALRETDDGCPACLEELECAEDLAIKLAERNGKYEFVDIFLNNIPGYAQDEDKFWEFDVTLTFP